MGGKLSLGERDSLIAYLLGQLVEQGLGLGWFSGSGEAGASTLAGIAVQSEIADQQDLAAGLEEIQIKASRLVVEYSQADDLLPQVSAILGSVLGSDADVDQQPGADAGELLIIDTEPGKFYSLD